MEKILQSVYVTEIVDEIESMFESKPDARKKSEVLEWKNNINLLIDRVNKLSKIEMYNKQ
tara:strand:+ start:393 stop:572 length:180 start_codon:yes stop_codon:yes gene_type:complete